MPDDTRTEECREIPRPASEFLALPEISRRFCQALRLASLAHHDQYRLDGTPALWHPIEVFYQLQRHDVTDVDLLCAGLLHDSLEDNPERHQELLDLIRSELGEAVADWVEMLTDKPDLPSSQARKAHQLLMLRNAPPEVITIKLADRLANLISGPAPSWNANKCAAYAEHSWQVLAVAHSAHNGLQQTIRETLQQAPWNSTRFS